MELLVKIEMLYSIDRAITEYSNRTFTDIYNIVIEQSRHKSIFAVYAIGDCNWSILKQYLEQCSKA